MFQLRVPKARERKIVGAQKLAYQASCREREATHGGPKFYYYEEVLCCGSSREMLRTGNIWSAVAQIMDTPKSPSAAMNCHAEIAAREAETERVVMHICMRDVRYITGIRVHNNRCRDDAYIFANKLAIVPFIKF